MKIEIRSILVNFSNPIFQGRLEMSDVLIQSTTPEWKKAALPHCRYKNEDEGSVIIYKMCTWTSLKVEGWEVVAGSSAAKKSKELAQLRLITNETKIRVALKRCTSDCRIMYMRVSVHLGDLLWVLTQSQLKATSMLVQSLIEAALKWAQKEQEAMRGSQESVDSVGRASGGQPEEEKEEKVKQSHRSKKGGGKDMVKEAKLRHLEWDYQEGKQNLPANEVIQDSFHVKTGTVDLQLCDDKGSLLLQLKELIVDVYPDQAATTGRCHWHKANSKLEENVQWSRELVKLSSKVQHIDLPSVSLFQLRERGIVVRCSHFQICPVDGEKRELPIITSDKDTFKIPDEADNPAFQCGLTMYYYTAQYAHKFLG